MTNNKKTTLFIVDRNLAFLKELKAQFEAQTRYHIHTFQTGEECIANLGLNPDVIFIGIDLNSTNAMNESGYQVLVKLKTSYPALHVIMLTDHDNLEEASNCQKYEAYDYLIKNETLFTRSLLIIARLYQHRRVENSLRKFKTGTYLLVALLVILVTILPILIYIFSPDC